MLFQIFMSNYASITTWKKESDLICLKKIEFYA